MQETPTWIIALAAIGAWSITWWSIRTTVTLGDAIATLRRRRRRRCWRGRHLDPGDALTQRQGGGLTMRAAGWWPEDEERH